MLYCPLCPLPLSIFLFSLFLLHQLLSLSVIQMPVIFHPASLFLFASPVSVNFLTSFSLLPFHIPACFCLPFSTPSIIFIYLFLSLSLPLAVPLLSYLLVYLCVCVCTDNSLAGSIHRYSRPPRAPLFILSRSSSAVAQEEGPLPANCMCEQEGEREK